MQEDVSQFVMQLEEVAFETGGMQSLRQSSKQFGVCMYWHLVVHCTTQVGSTPTVFLSKAASPVNIIKAIVTNIITNLASNPAITLNVSLFFWFKLHELVLDLYSA